MQFFEPASRLGVLSKQENILIATAESCTGGWLAESITAVPGSSTWFERGFVTYSNISKQEMLGVSAKTLEQFGAVSKQVASEMAEGALSNSHAQISISITGIAGPGGGSEDKPVGTVCFAVATSMNKQQSSPTKPITKNVFFSGDRYKVRQQAVITALEMLIKVISELKK